MIPELGHFALILALFIAAAQLHPLLSARAALLQTALCLFSFLALLWSFAVSDFTVIAVAELSHTQQPLWHKLTGPWRDSAGLMIFSALVLGLAGLAPLLQKKDRSQIRLTGAYSLMVLAITVFLLKPFERIYPPPFEGLAVPASATIEQAAAMPAFTAGVLASADIEGPALINFFASWCPPCEAEHSVLTALSEDMKIYGIAYKDNDLKTDAFLQRLGNPYEARGGDPDGTVAESFDVPGVPSTIVIDAQNRIIYRHLAPLTEDDVSTIKSYFGGKS